MSLRIDQATYDAGGLLTNSGDPRSLVPGPVPTATGWHQFVAGTLPEHWWPLDDDPALMVGGKGEARDLGRLGSVPVMTGYSGGSSGRMRTDDHALASQYQIDEDNLKTGGLRRGMSHVPPGPDAPTPCSLEFNRADSGMGSIDFPISQSIDGSNSTMMFFFRARSWQARRHDYGGYLGTPWSARILGQYDDMAATPRVAFDLNTQGKLLLTWSGAQIVTAPLNLNQIYQVLVVSTYSKVTLYLNGVEVGSTTVGGGGIGGAGAPLRVGGYRIENYVDRGFQGEISNIAIWSYAMDLQMREFGLSYIPTYIKPLRRLALMAATPTGKSVAQPMLRDRSLPMRTAVRIGLARPILKTDGPAPPSNKFGLALNEVTRLLTNSLQDARIALVSSVGAESGAGTELTGGGYARQTPSFTIVNGVAIATAMRFADLVPTSIQGWEVWSGAQRRWYGYWSLTDATWTLGVLTAADHGLSSGSKVIFATGRAPVGLSANTPYYVRDVTTSTFQVSATVGGAALTIAGTGTTQFGRTLEVPVSDSVEIEAGHLKLKLN